MQDPKTLTRWMAFRLTPLLNGSVEKSPINIAGGLASCSDPSTWAPYSVARNFVDAHPDHSLGFVLGKEVGLCVVDIDKARVSKDAPWPEWVEREVQELGSFDETSVSGLGRHVWVWGSIPANRHNRDVQVEIHDSNKMFCVSREFAEEWEKIKARDLAELYMRIDLGHIGPNYQPKIIALAYNKAKFDALMAGEIGGYFTSRSEAVASVLANLAVKHNCDREAMREEFEASALCDLWADKWSRLGDRELDRAIKWYDERKTQADYKGKRLEFTRPEVAHIKIKGKGRQYVAKPKTKFDGWFPRGSVSIIGGPSGAGKTTVMLDLLAKQQHGESYLDHPGGELPFLVLFADREEEDNEETLERLHLDEAGLDMQCLSWCWDFEAASAILAAVESRAKLPGAVLVEGADMLPSEPTKMPIVAMFVKQLQKIAKYYRIALVLSVGAPKATPDGQHALLRDRIFGSQIWGRMAATIVTMSIPGDGTGKYRQLDVQHRNAESEKWPLEFMDGLLVPRVQKVEASTFELWAQSVSHFTFTEAMGVMSKRAPRMAGKKILSEKIGQLIDLGVLETFCDKEYFTECFKWVYPAEANAPEEVIA